MRRAEIVTAGILAVFSIYLMWKSTELDIGYIRGDGPGGGAWPFWLSAIMLGCTVLIAINWARRTSPPAQSSAPFLDDYGKKMLVLVGGGVAGFIGLIHVVGVYGAMLVFLIYYVRFLGRHGWTATIAIAVLGPVTTFFFFDVLMRIVLPKGYLEPLFIPLYHIFL
jgi:hypothetical protein